MLKKSEEYHFIFNNIIELCNKKNITVSNLLLKFSTSKSAMTAWKKGNIYPDTLINLAEYFDISLDYLMTGKEEIKLTQNEQELLSIFRNLDDRNQIKAIGKIEDYVEIKNRQKRIGIQVARTTDGIPIRQEVTPEILETIKNLPEDTDY